MKVLIISHNCFSETQNMGKTLASLFSRFEKDELMQLYLYPSIPNTDNCDNYFRITDKDVIKSILKRSSCGNIVEPQPNMENGLFDTPDSEKSYNSIKRNSFFVRRVRDIVWMLGNWKSRELKNWLKERKPDVIFFALGDAIFSQNIAMWAAKYLGIPLITYVCDDYYFYGKQGRLSDKLLNFGLIKNIEKTIKSSKRIVTICDRLGEDYQKEFGTPYTTVMTGSSFEIDSLKAENIKSQLSYIGNLSLGRWQSLLEIQSALNKINFENNSNYELVYYGRENENLAKKITYGGFLDAEGVKKVMAESMLLIHTESFIENYKQRVKYSVSTKIADSLASGRCLLAYGPEQIASMQHLVNNDSAYCITNKNELFDKLSLLLNDYELILKYGKHGIETAKKYHSTENNSDILYNLFSNLV